MGLEMGERNRVADDALNGAAKARYGALLTYSNDSVLIVDARSLGLLAANTSACARFRFKSENIDSTTLNHFLPGFTCEKILEFLVDASRTGPPRTRIFVTLPGNTSEEGRVELGISLDRVDGNAYAIIVAREATEHARAEEGLRKSEEALRQSEDKYRTILENIQEGYYEVDLEGNFTFFNQALCRIMGYTPQELIGRNFREGYRSEESIEAFTQTYTRVYETGVPNKAFDWRFYTKSGEEKVAEFSISLIRDSLDDPIGFRGIIRDITERKRAEEALKESLESYRRMFESIQDIYYETNVDGEIVEVSPSIEALSGYTREELLGRQMAEFYVQPQSRAKLMQQMAQTGAVHDYEIVLKNKDGANIPVSITAKLQHDENGRPEKIIGSMRDVTERKLAETALRDSEALFRAISEQLPDGLFLLDLDDPHRPGRIVHVNPAAAKMYGYTPDELLGRSIEEILDKETAGGAQERREKIADGETIRFEAVHVRKDGSTFPSEVVTRMIQYGGRRVALTIDRDITERKKAEENLRESQALLARAQQIARLGSWVWNVQKNDLSWSDQIYSIFNMEIGTFGGTFEAFLELVAEEDRPRVESLVSDALENRKPIEFEHAITRPDGTERIVFEQGEVILDEQGEIALIVGTTQDITERRKAEQERQHLERQILQTQKLESLGVLAGGIAHDFNNLLTGVLGYANLARQNLPETSPAHKHLQEIERVANRAADLTQQMLAYSGRGKFVIQMLDLSRVVNDLARLLQVSISKKARLEYDFCDDLLPIEADATQIQQVVMNLMTNASDALGDETGVIGVRTGLIRADEEYLSDTYIDDNLACGLYAYVEVSDTGCGMDDETKARIFDPFFTTKFTGRGLGLAAVLGIVRGHGGTIKIESELGKGTTTRVLFPCADQPAGAAAIDNPPDEAAAPIENWHGTGKILVVDDEEVVRSLAKNILEDAGYSVMTAKDGQEGVEMFSECADEITVVLLDLTMPNMDGEETFRELCKIRSDIPVILSSGYNEEDIATRFDGKGLAGFIHKPYRVKNLMETLAQVLS